MLVGGFDMSKQVPEWVSRPGKTEFDGALRYLSLQFRSAMARRLVAKARRAVVAEHVAKDVLRASRLPLLPTDERHVADNLKKIRKGKPLTPVIAVQGDWMNGRPLIIADGYHRMCAACHADEDSPIKLVIVSP
jgi:hypothetical protein